MLCDICKQNVATVHLTDMAEGKTMKADLCPACAKQKGVDDPAGYSLAGLLMELGQVALAEKPAEEDGKQLVCTHCGLTQADFKKTGRLGCSCCYEVFNEGLDGLLKTMHKGTRHVGKAPFAVKESVDLADKMKTLRKNLEKAISEEDFEQAARLRDEIRVVGSRLNQVTVA